MVVRNKNRKEKNRASIGLREDGGERRGREPKREEEKEEERGSRKSLFLLRKYFPF